MIKISGDRTLYVDVDDSLIGWQLSEFPELPRVTVGDATVFINQKNVNLVRKFAKLGYTVIIWSQSGADWAEKAAHATGLNDVAAACLTKPGWLLDDLPPSEWLGKRLWRHPVTGNSD